MIKINFRSSGVALPGMVIMLLLLAMVLNASSCKEKEEAVKPSQIVAPDSVFYEKDIYSMMSVNCTPCHFPLNGHEKMLNTYDSAKKYIDEILYRVQLDVNDSNFMPYLQKRPPLTEEQIQLFKDWKYHNFPQ